MIVHSVSFVLISLWSWHSAQSGFGSEEETCIVLRARTSRPMSFSSPRVESFIINGDESDYPTTNIKSSSTSHPLPDDDSTFNNLLSIHVDQPIGSLSISPANRDVALGARKGLFIIDLSNPYDTPRFIPALSSASAVEVQWNPWVARTEWVASTYASIQSHRGRWSLNPRN